MPVIAAACFTEYTPTWYVRPLTKTGQGADSRADCQHQTNLRQRPRTIMNRSSAIRLGLGIAALATAVAGTVATAPTASAKPDTGCMRAGIDFLKDNGLFSAVAENGLPI